MNKIYLNFFAIFLIVTACPVQALVNPAISFNNDIWKETLGKLGIATAPLGKYNIRQNSEHNYSGSLRGMKVEFTTNDKEVNAIACEFSAAEAHIHRNYVVDLISILMKNKFRSADKILTKLQGRLYKLKKDGEHDNIRIDGININLLRLNGMIKVNIN